MTSPVTRTLRARLQAPSAPGRRGATELQAHTSFGGIAPEWDRLAVETGASPFLRPGWIEAWWRAFGHGELRILAVRRSGRLRGVLPLVEDGNVLCSPTNWHTPEFGPVASDAEALTRLLEGALVGEPRRLDISFLDADGPAVEALSALSERRALARRSLLSSPYIPVDGDWDAYVAGLGKNLRKGIRRTRRRLEELGRREFTLDDGGERFEELLEQGIALEAKGWKGDGGTAIASRPETRRFYLDVAEWARSRGLLRLAVLRLDGRMIAFELALQDARSYYMLKPAYEPELAKFGPGKIMTWDTLEHVFSAGLRSNEFLGSDDDYKLVWTESCRERVQMQLFAGSAAGRIDALVQNRGRALARRVKSLTA